MRFAEYTSTYEIARGNLTDVTNKHQETTKTPMIPVKTYEKLAITNIIVTRLVLTVLHAEQPATRRLEPDLFQLPVPNCGGNVTPTQAEEEKHIELL